MSITPVQTDYNMFFEGLSIQEMIYEARKWLGVGETDTTRYSNADIITALNLAQERFAFLTGCLLMPVIIVVKANWQNYRLPYNSYRVMAASFYKTDYRYDYKELTMVRDRTAMKKINPNFRGDTGDPEFCFPSYRAGNNLLVGVSPIPTTDGTSWTGDEYGVVTSATGFTNVGNITGTHIASGYSGTAYLVDNAGRDLSALGVAAGHMVFNTTDGSSGQITSLADAEATNDRVNATLSGGTDNDWDLGDSFQIPMSEYGVVIDATDEESYMMSSYLGTIANIYGKSGNLLLDVARKPLQLSTDNLTGTTEIPAAHHPGLIGYAVWWLGSRSFNGVIAAEKAKEGKAVFDEHVADYLGLGQTEVDGPRKKEG